MERIWEFNTERFTITLECESERDPDLSWADEETLDKLERGIYDNVTFAVRVLMDGTEISADYLSNSIYERVSDFRTEHIGLAALSRRDGVTYGSYFPDMVRQAVSEARERLCNTPRMRCA